MPLLDPYRVEAELLGAANFLDRLAETARALARNETEFKRCGHMHGLRR